MKFGGVSSLGDWGIVRQEGTDGKGEDEAEGRFKVSFYVKGELGFVAGWI